MKRAVFIGLLVLVSVFLTGCSGNDVEMRVSTPEETRVNTDIKITFYIKTNKLESEYGGATAELRFIEKSSGHLIQKETVELAEGLPEYEFTETLTSHTPGKDKMVFELWLGDELLAKETRRIDIIE